MADAPQVAYAHGGLESFQAQPGLEQTRSIDPTLREATAHYGNDDVVHKPATPSTILGLRRRAFWTLLLLAILVVAISVGGSVGGTLAAQKNGQDQKSAVTQATDLSTARTSTATSVASSSHTPSSTSSQSLYTPLPPSAVPKINVSCPELLVSWNRQEYDCQNDTDIHQDGGDIIGIQAYTLQQCVDACSTLNKLRGATTCFAISINSALADNYDKDNAANCWLKNGSLTTREFEGVTTAVLKS